jgi:hypothetical protein
MRMWSMQKSPRKPAAESVTRRTASVSRHFQKVHVRLDREALVDALVYVAVPGAMAVRVPPAHVRHRQPVHEPAKVAVLARPQKQVPMIGHQAVRQQSHPRQLQHLDHRLLECGIVAFFGKHLISVVAAVEAVEHNAARGGSSTSWHHPSLPDLI